MRNACEKISGSELTVMRVLWEAGEPIPLAVLRERLAQERSWEPSTVKTLLRRKNGRFFITCRWSAKQNITKVRRARCLTRCLAGVLPG